MTQEIGENFRRKDSLSEEKENLKKFLDSYALEREKRDKLVHIYQAGDNASLAEIIDERLRKVILDGELKRIEAEKLEKQLENLRQCSPSVMSSAA